MAIILPYIRVPTTDPDIYELQRQVEQHITEVARHPHVASEVLDAAEIATTDTQVAHKLGRTPIGWRIVDVTAGWGDVRRSSWDSEYITLIAAATTTIAIEVW